MINPMLLIAEHLTKTYAHRRGWSPAPAGRHVLDAVRPALADASLSLERGESIGVVGESGSGKSTFARCLALLERRTRDGGGAMGPTSPVSARAPFGGRGAASRWCFRTRTRP